MNILCVIPSRLGSTRLARKALLPIMGKPMIQWVYEGAKSCPIITEVVVATDSVEIGEIISALGGTVEYTAPDIATGSDRVATVAKKYETMQVIINLQGDEPFIKSSMLTKLVEPYLQGEDPDMTTLAFPLNMDDYHCHEVVKVILDQQQNAIYFSRAPIPHFRKSLAVPLYHHMGLYAFKRDFLLTYAQLTQTPLEKAESLEQLRVLEHGYKIRVCLTEEKTLDINNLEEYERAQNFAQEFVGN